MTIWVKHPSRDKNDSSVWKDTFHAQLSGVFRLQFECFMKDRKIERLSSAEMNVGNASNK